MFTEPSSFPFKRFTYRRLPRLTLWADAVAWHGVDDKAFNSMRLNARRHGGLWDGSCWKFHSAAAFQKMYDAIPRQILRALTTIRPDGPKPLMQVWRSRNGRRAIARTASNQALTLGDPGLGTHQRWS